MSWAKSEYVYTVIYAVILLAILYIGLVGVDFIIPRISSHKPEVLPIVEKNYVLDSQQQKKNLIDLGFQPVISLAGVERHIEFRKAMLDNSMLGIGIYPDTDILYCNEGYGWQTYRSDKYGFRNDNVQYLNKVDVAIFGDSYIHGGCVPNESTISQTMSRHSNTLGYGIGGSDPIHYAAMINVMLPKVMPKYAGIAFYNNDFNDSDRSSEFYKFWLDPTNQRLDYFADDGELNPNVIKYYEDLRDIHTNLLEKDQQNNERWPLSLIDRFIKIEKYLLLNNVRALLYQYFPNLIPLVGISPSTRVAMEELISKCNVYGCVPFITYLPNSNFWNPNFRTEYYEAQLKYFSAANQLKFISLSNVIDVDSMEDFAPMGGHYSIDGYERVGKHLAEQLGLKD